MVLQGLLRFCDGSVMVPHVLGFFAVRIASVFMPNFFIQVLIKCPSDSYCFGNF